ncbi:DNA-processing protein DprA [Camelliibacillus cellulosilyticus]|uniref:DNA-processing protein DprA n=1 Tax=Camelliibacillus cellulosilyticus TaxID=2174486 RepID=A0ABV9GJA1_9BACL
MDFQERLIHLHHCRGVGWRTMASILDVDPELTHLYDLTIHDLTLDFNIRPDRASLLMKDLSSIDIQKKLLEYRQKAICPIVFNDPDYPKLLKEIFDPPWVLYVKGRVAYLKQTKTLAVVGTRQPSFEGLKCMETLLKPLISDGWMIISGMALGVDGKAHELALNGSTIAVLGSGLYHPYPLRFRELFDKIVTDHLAISEYPPDTPPRKWQFPERNRIISGLSRGVLVVEAKARSGSLITADQALEQGRDVFAMPGSILNPNAEGTHWLIKQGAKLAACAEDLFQELSVV